MTDSPLFSAVARFLRHLGVERQLSPITLLNYQRQLDALIALADEAGLSISRFAELFRDKVGLAIVKTLTNSTGFAFGDMTLWGEMYPLDLALLPMGGVFTMDARQAALACKLLGCKAVVPMHWGTFPVLAQNAASFKVEHERMKLPCRCVEMAPGETVNFG